MIIECPGCQETYEVDMPSVAPDGIEIHCKHCNRRFLIRPHGAPAMATPPAAKDPTPPSPPAPERDPFHVPSPPSPSGTAIEPSIFLQRDEMPYAVVQAYEQLDGSEALTSFPKTDESWRPEEGLGGSENEEDEILLDSDETGVAEGLGGLADDDYFSTPYPLGKNLVVGRKKRSRHRLRVWLGGGLMVLAIVALALLARQCSWKASWERVRKLGEGALSLIPFNRLESGKIQISDLNGYFQDRAGNQPPVFVIEGKVTNHYKSPCHSIQVKGTLFDERGNRALERVAYCGNVLKTEQIRSYSQKQIEQILQNAYGETLSNFNIEPGRSVPFMLVFFDPPGKLSEFSLEVSQYTLQDQGKS